MLELKSTNHNYYCSENNYYIGNQYGENFGRCEYDTWEDFKKEWLDKDGTIDCYYNLCFRFDIVQKQEPKTGEPGEPIEGYQLWLFFILQRKGIYRPVLVKNIVENNMKELEKFLLCQWEYMKSQWIEIDKKN